MPESRQRRRHGRPVSRAAAVQTALRPRRRKVNKLYLLASALIAILVIAGFALSGIGGGGGQRAIPIDTGSNGSYVEGVGVQQELMPTEPDGLNLHVPEIQDVVYTTVPPTSGDHWSTPARCGFFAGGLPDERIVHNLEHGNIVVSYNLATDAKVRQLRSAISDIPLAEDWGVIRSYDGIQDGQVALATWGVSEVIQGIDSTRMALFFEYAGNLGPETVTCSGAPAQHVR